MEAIATGSAGGWPLSGMSNPTPSVSPRFATLRETTDALRASIRVMVGELVSKVSIRSRRSTGCISITVTVPEDVRELAGPKFWKLLRHRFSNGDFDKNNDDCFDYSSRTITLQSGEVVKSGAEFINIRKA